MPKPLSDFRLICARLTRPDHKAFLAAIAILGCSKSSFIREAIAAALANLHGADYRAAYDPAPLPPPEPAPSSPMPILPRTKPTYQGTSSAIRPIEGQRIDQTRGKGVLLAPAPPPGGKRSENPR